MKYLRGFLMAWGMFCWIPCPYKQWREEDRKAMVLMLPAVGLFIGVCLCIIWKLLIMAGAGRLIAGALITGAYFLLTGFIHLDGFMDCSDATLPRHAEMETRIRILKDSHSGAFAVICLCMMLMVFAGAAAQAANRFDLFMAGAVTGIFTLSRFVSAVCVTKCRPMATSQYAGSEPKGTVVPAVVLTAAILVLCEAAALCKSPDLAAAAVRINLILAVVAAAAAVTGHLDRKMLGGMNGDISGHMITMSEMFGMAAMALVI